MRARTHRQRVSVGSTACDRTCRSGTVDPVEGGRRNKTGANGVNHDNRGPDNIRASSCGNVDTTYPRRIAPRARQAYGPLLGEEEATARDLRTLPHHLGRERRARRVSGEAWGFPALFHERGFSFDRTLRLRLAPKGQRATHHIIPNRKGRPARGHKHPTSHHRHEADNQPLNRTIEVPGISI